MAAKTMTEAGPQTLARPAVRSRQIGIRLTEAEYSELETTAWKSRKTLADWAHDLLLSNRADFSSEEMQLHIFTELVGIQMLLLATNEQLLRGDKKALDQLNSLFRQVQATKAAKAQELLARRSQKQEK
jgi:hypothetical protein